MESKNDTILLQRYEELRETGVESGQRGRFTEARPLLEEALDLARRIGDPALTDLAFCNWASVKIALSEEADLLLPTLREILLRSDNPANCRLAAYHISRIYELGGENRKGLFYARIARDRTAQIDDPDPAWIASNHHQIANFLVADSRFEDALDEYRRALEAHPSATSYRTHMIRQNIGFCHLMLGRPLQAFGHLFDSLRAFRGLNARPLLAVNHLDLAYAYLEIGRSRRAIGHAQRALMLAEEHHDETSMKNARYLLGEAWHQSGDDEAARRQFEKLADCYDGLPFIADFLLTVDVRQLINLRA